MTRAGVMPGGDAVCHGYHVWDGDECVRCGFVDQGPDVRVRVHRVGECPPFCDMDQTPGGPNHD